MRGIWILIALTGCRQILGLADPQVTVEDAGSTIDVRVGDASIDATIPQGEVSHFAFDTIAGNKTPDDVGHRDATCTDATRPAVVAGHRANALQFVNPDYVMIPAAAASDGQALTIALWFELLGTPLGTTSDCLLYQASTLSLCAGSANQLTFATSNNGNSDSLTSPNLDIGIWHHVAVSFDGQGKRLYIDGILVAADTALGSSTGNAIAVGAALTGFNGQPGSYASANLDELAIYARALSATEVEALAHQ